MANREHLELIQQGKDAVADYLAKHVDVILDLSGADLSDADLHGYHLQTAILIRANLKGANLRMANLTSADLRWANLEGANLSRATLHLAGLGQANLCRANLSHATLTKANLSQADLRYANGSETNLNGSQLTGAKVYRLKAAKWSVYGINCDWLNLSPGGDDAPLPHETWKPEQGKPSPFENPEFENLLIELNCGFSVKELSHITGILAELSERFESVDPAARLDWKQVRQTEERMEIVLTSIDPALSALARLLEAAVRSVRKSPFNPQTRALALDAEQSTLSIQFVQTMTPEDLHKTTAAVTRLAYSTHSINYKGESMRLKETARLAYVEEK